MAKSTRKDEDGKEAERILKRVNVESDIHGGALFDRSKERARKHFSAADSEGDWVERTGTRIGRYLSVVLLMVIVFWLINVIRDLGQAQ